MRGRFTNRIGIAAASSASIQSLQPSGKPDRVRRSGAKVRGYFKVLVRSTRLLTKSLMRWVSPRSAPPSTAAFAGMCGAHPGDSSDLSAKCCALVISADRLPCLRASRRTADLSVCCFLLGLPPNATLVGLAAPSRSRFLASVEVPRPLPFLRSWWAVYARCSAPVLWFRPAGCFFLRRKMCASRHPSHPSVFDRSSRTPPVLKLVALRFCRSQPWKIALLTLSDHQQEFPQTV